MKTSVKEDLMILTKVEMDLLENGKVSCEGVIEDAKSQDRLQANHFYGVQNKYHYGITLGSYPTLKKQLKAIIDFKKYIMKNDFTLMSGGGK